MSLAFAIDHRPGTLVAALERLAWAGVDLTKIESRPVPGSPWEYVFYVDVRFDAQAKAETAVAALTEHCRMIKVLGRYRAAVLQLNKPIVLFVCQGTTRDGTVEREWIL